MRLRNSLTILPAIMMALTLLLAGALPPSWAQAQENTYANGARAYQSGNFTTARRIWGQLADSGDASAQFALGVMSFNGIGASADVTRAVNWFERAANNGNSQAMFNYGLALWQGTGVERNTREAIRWWRRAADSKEPGALHNLGVAYYQGEGVTQDYDVALSWLQRARSAGHAESEEAIAMVKEERSELTQYKNSQTNNAAVSVAPTPEPPTKPETETEVAAVKPAVEAIAETAAEQGGAAQALANSTSESAVASEATQSAAVETPVKNTQPSPAAAAQNKSEAVVSRDDMVEVYAWPVERHGAFDQISPDTELEVIHTTQNWMKVRSDKGFRVWVHERYLEINSDGSGVITAPGVRARPRPSTGDDSPPIGLLSKNAGIKVLESDGEWRRVVAPASLGAWVKKNSG